MFLWTKQNTISPIELDIFLNLIRVSFHFQVFSELGYRRVPCEVILVVDGSQVGDIFGTYEEDQLSMSE